MKPRLKLANKTHYSTRDLRRFFYAGLRALGAEANKIIEVDYCRRRTVDGHDGRAHYGNFYAARWMRFGLPRSPAELDLGKLARVLRHENAHNLGLKHGEMEPDLRYCQGPDPGWIAGLSISVKPTKARPLAPPVREVRYASVCARLGRWTKTRDRAERAIQKLTIKKRYYERTLALAAKEPAP
jgi:hypothetical protein